MIFTRSTILISIILILSAFDVAAITFEQIFFTGDGNKGKLGNARTQFAPDDSRIYLRFIYHDGQPGQKLIAYWRILEDVRGRRGEFAKSEMRLEKSSDKGQFSFNAEEPWAVGRYRVTITDSDNIILEEMDFQVVSNQSQSNLNLEKNTFIEEQDDELPPSLLDQYQPAQDNLIISRLFTSGRKEASKFKASEKAVYIRFEYEGAAQNQAIDAIWEHLGDYDESGIGVFARDRITLDEKSGKAQFSFKPKPAGSWLAGGYQVVLLSSQKIIGKTQFSVESSGKQTGRYNEIVNLVSHRTGSLPKIVDNLYRHKPALFAPIGKTLALVKVIEEYTNQSMETLSRNINWSKSETSNLDLVRTLDEALRNYRVSSELLPKGVKTAKLPERLTNTYVSLRNQLPASQAYAEALNQTVDFKGHTTLHAKLISAKGESIQTVSEELSLYLLGKANLYWMNKLEASFMLQRLKSQKETQVNKLWKQREQDLNLIKNQIAQ